MSQVSVLVGFAEALAAPEAVWSLVDGGFRVVAFTRRGKASALRFSRHVELHEIEAPESNLEGSLSDLRRLAHSLLAVSKNSRWVLMPFDDKALFLCSKVDLSADWTIAGPTGENASLALNKCLQVEAAQRAGFLVPKTIIARTAQEIREFAAAESFPIMMKAAECVPIVDGHVHSGGNWICADEAELDRAISQWGEKIPLLVQEFVIGVGEGIFGLVGPEGVRAWSGHRRIRMMNPEGSGSSACASQSVSEDEKRCAGALLASAGWQGLFMLEMLRDAAGNLWFVELNGRVWGSLALSRRQGLEYPVWHVQLALDPASDAGKRVAVTAPTTCRNVGRELVHILFVLRGAKSSLAKKGRSRLRAILGVLRVHRGETLYNWRRDDCKVFFADSFYTVKDNVFKTKH